MLPDETRNQRLYDEEPSRFRSESERDRDRVLYSSALRRLAEVTQVVAPTEGHVFHNRLTHTLEVAQIGRRLAQKLSDAKRDADSAAIAKDLAASDPSGAIDPDVVEAAALLHDLGHPPFGHVAEKELNRLMLRAGHPDGYEGNAQSLRIAAALEIQNADAPQGLNLTRATLRASLKYPCVRPTE